MALYSARLFQPIAGPCLAELRCRAFELVGALKAIGKAFAGVWSLALAASANDGRRRTASGCSQQRG